MGVLGFVVIVAIVIFIVVKVSLSDENSPNSNLTSQNTTTTQSYSGTLNTEDTEIWVKLARENSKYVIPLMQNDPIMYPKTKGAVSRMTEADRNAYHDAVKKLKERIEKEPVPINAFYQAVNLDKYSASLLAKAQKRNEPDKAKMCAMNLFYSKICMAACFSDTGTIPQMDLWLRDYGFICLNLSYFKVGRITGKRGGQNIEDMWAGDFEKITQALDPDKIVKISTNWRKIRDMAEELKADFIETSNKLDV